MDTINIRIDSGKETFDNAIVSKLKTNLLGFAINLTRDSPDIIVTTLDQIKSYGGAPIVALTDCHTSVMEYENILEYTPTPITENDYLRLEFRLIAAAGMVRDAN